MHSEILGTNRCNCWKAVAVFSLTQVQPQGSSISRLGIPSSLTIKQLVHGQTFGLTCDAVMSPSVSHLLLTATSRVGKEPHLVRGAGSWHSAADVGPEEWARFHCRKRACRGEAGLEVKLARRSRRDCAPSSPA
ncbi:hypothetical protein EJ06DRAFT_258447 [Trichodelitschia bisporula]|uniref:Uncharacterized protein n=1 Tax=Trichodelitschia bisporula TaxID=703511 RepID=A0A6G1HJG8_9PEZI|nr:hypothetical protein EJ06DRAFT_258447 [Trichodelitschia bisporula]